jgi:GT2 family glycosyltransferase
VRNQVCSEAAGDLIVFFDDDAEPADPTLIARSARRFDELPLLGAVAFRQTSADGRPHRIQPDSSSEPCFVPNFYGYGFMVDGAAVASVGGFEEILGYYFDEDEFCLRLMDAGCQVIYDPSLSVIHHDDRSRDWTSIKRLMLRNRTLTTLLHYPLWATAPAIARDWVQQVAKMHSAGGIDWVGLRETTYEIVRLMPYVMRKRAPVRFSTLLRARNLRRASKPLEIALSTVTS